MGDYRDFDETVQTVDKSVRLIASVILYCFILFYLFIEMNLNLLPICLEVSKKTTFFPVSIVQVISSFPSPISL